MRIGDSEYLTIVLFRLFSQTFLAIQNLNSQFFILLHNMFQPSDPDHMLNKTPPPWSLSQNPGCCWGWWWTPDARCAGLASKLSLDFALMHKERVKAGEISKMILVSLLNGLLFTAIRVLTNRCCLLRTRGKQFLRLWPWQRLWCCFKSLAQMWTRWAMWRTESVSCSTTCLTPVAPSARWPPPLIMMMVWIWDIYWNLPRQRICWRRREQRESSVSPRPQSIFDIKVFSCIGFQGRKCLSSSWFNFCKASSRMESCLDQLFRWVLEYHLYFSRNVAYRCARYVSSYSYFSCWSCCWHLTSLIKAIVCPNFAILIVQSIDCTVAHVELQVYFVLREWLRLMG